MVTAKDGGQNVESTTTKRKIDFGELKSKQKAPTPKKPGTKRSIKSACGQQAGKTLEQYGFVSVGTPDRKRHEPEKDESI